MDSLLGAVLAAGIVANAVILGLLVLQAGRQARNGGAGSAVRSDARRPRALAPSDGVSDGGANVRRAGESAVTALPAALSPTGSAAVVVGHASPRPDPPNPTDDALARAIEAFVGSGGGDRGGTGAVPPAAPQPRVAESVESWDPGGKRGSRASPGTATPEPRSARIRIAIERLDRIADRLGSAVADRVLEQVVSGIAAASRSSDRVTRLADSTIEIALSGTGVAADRYAERTRRACDEWFEASALGLRATVLPAAPEGDDAAGRG